MTPAERREMIADYGAAGDRLADALMQFPREMWTFKPGPERWSIHEILVHIADSEVNSYVRCRRFIAEPGSAVMAYDENRWASELNYGRQNAEDAVKLFRLLRRMSHRLIRDLPEVVWANTIEHPENGTMSMDDWLKVYAEHIPAHIAQMQATCAAWLEERQGKRPDPDRCLFPSPGAPAAGPGRD